jgi:hypothetical protein
MSERDPKLDTKYENDDPDFTSSGQSSSSSQPQRVQPTRKVKKSSFLDSVSSLFGGITSSEISESDDENEIESQSESASNPHHNGELNSPNSPHKEHKESNSCHNNEIDLTLTPHKDHSTNQIPFNIPQIIINPNVEPTAIAMTLTQEDQAAINQMIQTSLATANATKSSVPKVDLEKLTMTNYVDWAKKMRCTLKLNKLWIEPTKIPTALSPEEATTSEKAVLFMTCYLDEQNSMFVTTENEKCFITVWNLIKKFHQPRTSTALTDIHRQIQLLKHQPGQSIETHLMKMEAHFTKLRDISKPVDEELQVSLIMISVMDSSDFTHVFHSALWEDESSLTVEKVKSVLIATQKRHFSERNESAHRSNFQQQQYPPQRSSSRKRHNRKPKDPKNGWKCPGCEMDNHTSDNCRKKQITQPSNHQGVVIKATTKRANQVEDFHQNETNCNIAQAHSGTINSHNGQISSTIRNRLGKPVNTHTQRNVSTPKRPLVIDSDDHDDILDIDYVPSYYDDSINHDDISSSGNNHKHNSCPLIINHFSKRVTQNINPRMKSLARNERSQKSPQKSQRASTSMNCFNTLFCTNMNFKNEVVIANCNATLETNKSLKSYDESSWIVDSGATLHMCKSSDLLSNFTPHSGHNVIISDGSLIPIHGYGTLHISLSDSNNQTCHKLILDNVAVVPKLSVNLISVRQLASLGVSLNFTEQACYILHPSATILFAMISNKSYILKLRNSKNAQNVKVDMAMTCIHDWHRKMGHRNLAHIQKVKDILKLKVCKCKCNSECIGCLKGKFHALPFPKLSEKPLEPRDVITTDVCGPFRNTSIGGSRYFVTFTCANTDYTEVSTIKAKSECKRELMNYIKRCMTQFGRFPKTVRSDRGGEYLDDEMQTFLKNNGIVFQCTVPRCPEQNGISERKNRTLLEAVRTMLFMKNLPNFLWAEALQHANNTFNNIPKKCESVSPKEKFFNKSFNYPFIEFGTQVFYTTNPQDRSKLAERGAPGIFVGIDHNSKGFRIFTQGKIRVERNVKFIDNNESDESVVSNETFITDLIEPESVPIGTHTELATTNEPRRSERIRLKQAHSALQQVYEPKTYRQAIACPEKDKWVVAMEEELTSIEINKTWSLVDLPNGRTPIGCRWVYKVKDNGDQPSRYKARLVAQGFTQKFGEDYDEVFAPVTRSSTFRTLLTIASKQNLTVQQFDVKTAFLNGTLQEEIYMKLPPNHIQSDKVLRLNKSLYGLKQAARSWNQTLNKAMTSAGFKQSKVDECLYIYKDHSHVCYSIVHVDDMIFASDSPDLIKRIVAILNTSFELKCLGDVKNYLGIEISRNQKGAFSISQSNYIDKIVTDAGLQDSKGSKYPIAPGYHKLEDNSFLDNNTIYRKFIGKLLYVSTNTRPDVSAAVGILAQRVSKPRSLDLKEVYRIIRYLHSTKDLKLSLYDEKCEESLIAYADSDWAEDRTTRKSISGVICKVFGGPVSWSSRKQDIVSTSTTEAEFYALSEAVKESQWLHNLLKDFQIETNYSLKVFSDNQSTIKMIENPKFSSRTKHIDVRLHFIRDYVAQGKIEVTYVPSEDNVADLLTKPLVGVKIQQLRSLSALQ